MSDQMVPPPPPDHTPPPASGSPDPMASPAVPAAAKKKIPTGAAIAIVAGVVAAVGAYFAITATTDKAPPTEADVTAAFVPLDGFDYTVMPSDSLEPLRQAFAAQGAEEAIEHFDARQVDSGGTPQAVVFIIAVDPDDMEGEFEDSYITGFTATSQASVEDLDINGTTGHLAETPLGTIAFFFDPDGLVFNIVGRDTATVQSIANSLQAGNS